MRMGLCFHILICLILDYTNLNSVIVISPGNPGTSQYTCFVTIHEINIKNKNILDDSLVCIPLIFSSNPNQTPIIGQTSFFEYVCCIDYKNQKFSIDKPYHDTSMYS